MPGFKVHTYKMVVMVVSVMGQVPKLPLVYLESLE